MKRTAVFILLTLSIICLVCSDECTYNIKYEITGTAPAGGVSVLIVNEYGDDEAFSSIKLPWVKEFAVQFRDDTYYGGEFTGNVFPAYVSATVIKYGIVTVNIYYRGKLVSNATARDKGGVATARYGVKF